MEKNTYFPFYVNIKEKKFLVYGAGNIATRRIKTLLDFEAKVTVIARCISADVILLAKENQNLELIMETYSENQIEGYDFVIAATDDKMINSQIYKVCKANHIPANNASNQNECDFFFPSIIRQEDLVIGITSGGHDHKKVRSAADIIRNYLSAQKGGINDCNKGRKQEK